MKAVRFDRFGGPEVLRVIDVPDPHAGPGQVRVAVYGAGTNPVDAGNRSDGTWAGIELPHVPGFDIAGIVDEIGGDVDGVAVGDRVMAMTPFPRGAGGYAELVAIDAQLVAPVQASISLIEAAGVPLAAGTAHDVLERIQPAADSWILVLGASGGVGTFFIQLAAARGLKTIAVGGIRSHEMLADLGATHCVDYHGANIASAILELSGGRMDAIVDFVGGEVLQESLAAVRGHGHLASIATPELNLDHVLDENLTFHGVLITDDGDRMRMLAGMLGDETIRPVMAEVFPIEDAAEAHRRLESGHTGGKIVLQLRAE